MANYISSLVVDYKDTKQLKYGVINLCDNTTYYGSTTWSVIDDAGITGLVVDGSPHDGVTLSENNAKYLVVTNTYTGTNADPVITVKASSDLVSCDTNNTCKITLKRACWHQSVIFEVEINDDSKNYVTNIAGHNTFGWGINSSDSSKAFVIVPVSQIGNNTTGKERVVEGNCSPSLSSGDKIYFNFYDNDINIYATLSNNIQNFSVSGEVKYKFGDDTYTTLDSLSSDIYTYTLKNGNSINITGCNYKTTQLHDLMDGFKTLYIKHIINLKYDDEVQEVQYKWYTMLSGQDTWSESTEFTITMSENDSYLGVGSIVAIAHCTGSDRSDCDSASAFTFKNDNTITLNKTWGLSDLIYDTGDNTDNYIILYTHKELYDNLLVADTGTYTISGEIVSSLDGSSFPVTVNYEVTNVNAWYKFNSGSLVEITELNIGKISLPETVINEIIVFMQNNNYITDVSKYSYEQITGDFTINLSFEPRQMSSSLKCIGIKISATDSEIAKLYENTNGIIFFPNVSGNIICEEKYKLPISFTFETPFRIHILNSSYETFPNIIHYIEIGLIEKESSGNTSGIYKKMSDNKMHYNMYRYNNDSDNTKYKYIFVDIYYHTGNISSAMLKCAYPPSSSSVIVQKSYPGNHPDNISNLRIVIPHTTDTEYFGDFVFTASK